MEKIHQTFKKYGVDEKDLPKAFVIYKTFNLLIATGVFTACYKYHPLKNNMNKYPLNLLTNYFKINTPRLYNYMSDKVEKGTDKIANSRFFKPIPNFFNLDSYKTTVAIGETIIIREFFTPITVPIKLFLTVMIIKKKDDKIIQSES